MVKSNRRSKQQQPKSLSQGRPNSVQKQATSLSARATRATIRSHHTLHKSRSRALAAGDTALAAALDEQITAQGGLESYQTASITGQSVQRGGDSSKTLAAWLEPVLRPSAGEKASKIKILDVGALSSKTAISKIPHVDVTSIDLHSQEPAILEQDFMARPLPSVESEAFDIVCLSLVLNYVPDAAQRGEMLKRTREFLAQRGAKAPVAGDILPCLFIVLPAPCILNSRYMNRARFQMIMEALGFSLVKEKVSARLIYSLWRCHGPKTDRTFTKVQINPGKNRNNFTVILA